MQNKDKIQSPWVLDGHRLTEEAGERASGRYFAEGTDENRANLVLADLAPEDMDRVLMHIWEADEELWNQFAAVEARLLDIMTDMAQQGRLEEIVSRGSASWRM